MKVACIVNEERWVLTAPTGARCDKRIGSSPGWSGVEALREWVRKSIVIADTLQEQPCFAGTHPRKVVMLRTMLLSVTTRYTVPLGCTQGAGLLPPHGLIVTAETGDHGPSGPGDEWRVSSQLASARCTGRGTGHRPVWRARPYMSRYVDSVTGAGVSRVSAFAVHTFHSTFGVSPPLPAVKSLALPNPQAALKPNDLQLGVAVQAAAASGAHVDQLSHCSVGSEMSAPQSPRAVDASPLHTAGWHVHPLTLAHVLGCGPHLSKLCSPHGDVALAAQ